MQNSNHKDDEEPIEQEQENKPKRPPNRYAIIDRKVLAELFCLQHVVKLQETHAQWMRESLRSDTLQRDDFWSKSLAVSHPSFLKEVKSCLGIKSRYREIEEQQDVHVLREPTISYTTHFRQE